MMDSCDGWRRDTFLAGPRLGVEVAQLALSKDESVRV